LPARGRGCFRRGLEHRARTIAISLRPAAMLHDRSEDGELECSSPAGHGPAHEPLWDGIAPEEAGAVDAGWAAGSQRRWAGAEQTDAPSVAIFRL
jgi:hypothetical protein